MSRTLWPLAALTMVALISAISAGCGSNAPSGAGTASSSGGGSSSGSGTGSASSAHQKAVKFSECMRENGYPDFPDPKASGEFPTFGMV